MTDRQFFVFMFLLLVAFASLLPAPQPTAVARDATCVQAPCPTPPAQPAPKKVRPAVCDIDPGNNDFRDECKP